VAQLERQKQGITRFAFTGVHDILERTAKNIEDWCKLRLSLWHWLCVIGNVFKTCHLCHDAAENEAGGKTKERRRSGKINTVAHEVWPQQPNQQRSRWLLRGRPRRSISISNFSSSSATSSGIWHFN
jgi:hypothetical protein